MAKNKQKTAKESDSVYFLKIVLFFLLGCLWINFGGENGIAIPFGLAIGFIFASHDHFNTDRKIEIAVLLFATILSYFLPIGFVLQIS